MYVIGEVAWLLAEQAHRYRQDLDRLGDERDEAVAQHDRDAETIAELREIAKWLVAEERHWRVQSRKRHVALEDAVRSLPISSFSQDYSVSPPKAEITLNQVTRLAERHRDDCRKYEGIIEASLDALLIPGPYGNLPDAVRRVVAERDGARNMLALAEGVAAALPDPDAQNPEHCQFAAELSAQLPPTGPNEDWEWTTARCLTARQWAERAKSLEAAQSAEAQRDREIEAVAKAFDQAVESDVTDRDAAIAAIDALDAARAEAGQ